MSHPVTKITPLADRCSRAAEMLKISFVAPFVLTLPSGARVEAEILVKQFGALNGMLILSDSTVVMRESAAITEAGFGFSVMSPGEPGEEIDLSVYIEVLRDWGWAGPPEEQPAWLEPAVTSS
jgi:hypothetical protein